MDLLQTVDIRRRREVAFCSDLQGHHPVIASSQSHSLHSNQSRFSCTYIISDNSMAPYPTIFFFSLLFLVTCVNGSPFLQPEHPSLSWANPLLAARDMATGACSTTPCGTDADCTRINCGPCHFAGYIHNLGTRKKTAIYRCTDKPDDDDPNKKKLPTDDDDFLPDPSGWDEDTGLPFGNPGGTTTTSTGQGGGNTAADSGLSGWFTGSSLGGDYGFRRRLRRAIFMR